ncbi:MAG: DUF167 domain-containing protein [Candidatus Moranbacteria bacterium]|nr:DUF167 domain-containing protein [Candidatus Moranbacteria bacterium]
MIRCIEVRVISRASKNSVQQRGEKTYCVRLTKAPVQNAANEQMKKLLAKHFSVPVGAIRILRGKTSRTKIVEVVAYAS